MLAHSTQARRHPPPLIAEGAERILARPAGSRWTVDVNDTRNGLTAWLVRTGGEGPLAEPAETRANSESAPRRVYAPAAVEAPKKRRRTRYWFEQDLVLPPGIPGRTDVFDFQSVF